MTTDLSKLQLNAVLSALDGQPRNPNTTRHCATLALTPSTWASASTICSRRQPACSMGE
jgi:hypothetical protein